MIVTGCSHTPNQRIVVFMMKKAEFRDALATLDLTQEAAAKFLDCGLRTVNGWANGNPIPAPVAHLLRLMVLMRLTVDDVPQ
jgi:hypothetical protein